MGKNDFLSPKDIANRIKAKGLQKLRWYCQLCQKQCRDENGFKCHQMSESHLRQMEVFGQNASRVISGFSEEFEASFLEHMRRAHPHSRIAAHVVYNEYIQDKHHIHMNSTQWLTLTDFVKHLGREGICKVEETPKGWFITLVHEDPADKLAGERRARLARREEVEEERQARLLAEQVARARGAAREDDAPAEATALVRDDDGAPMKLALAPGGGGGGGDAAAATAAAGPSGLGKRARPAAAAAVPLFGEDDDGGGGSGAAAANGGGKKLSKVEELMRRDLEAKRRRAADEGAAAAAAAAAAPLGPDGAEPTSSSSRGRADAWLREGIVVKIVSKALKEHGYYKQKAAVEAVIDRYVGELSVLSSGDVVRVDQAELETVIPAPGGRVRVVNGAHRGARGELVEIDEGKFAALVRLTSGPAEGRRVWFEYEDISKLA